MWIYDNQFNVVKHLHVEYQRAYSYVVQTSNGQ